jgi:hypothetical protein
MELNGHLFSFAYLDVWTTIRNAIRWSLWPSEGGWQRALQLTANTSAYLADYFVGIIRVLFAAFFFGCFLLRRAIHRPLSNLGFKWLTSGKPLFATLFGAIGTVVVFGDELTSLLK